MPEEGVPLHARGAAAQLRGNRVGLAGLFVGPVGIRRIRLTGGEPLVRKELTLLARRLGALKRRPATAHGWMSS